MAITAKNYAAQAEIALKQQLDDEIMPIKEGETKYAPDMAGLAEMITSIKSAQHFAIPDGGVVFDDNRKGIKGLDVRLPFPCVTIEYFGSPKKTLVIAKEISVAEFYELSEKNGIPLAAINEVVAESSSDLFIVIYALFDTHGRWMPVPVSVVIPSKWDSLNKDEIGVKNSLMCGGVHFVLLPSRIHPLVLDVGENEAIRRLTLLIGSGVKALLEFIEALSCKNIEFATIQSAPTAAESAKRAKKGKLPIYETKVLSLKTTENKSALKSTGLRAGHASPRQHLRRGHIRRLESGNIWVNSCIVGDASKGVVHKSYEVVA